MREYIIKRLIYTIITIFLVITLNFFLFRVMPSNPVDIMLNPSMGDIEGLPFDVREAVLHELGLDKPFSEQFVDYLYNMLTGNFGYSFKHPRPVLQIIFSRMFNTITLMLTANILSIFLSVVFGVLAAWRHGTKIDIFLLIFSLTLSSLPIFWVGGILLLIFSVKLNLFPMVGTVSIGMEYSNYFAYIADYVHHLILPTITMALLNFGGLFLILRSSMIDVFSEDYMLTAKAIGLSDRTIIFKNALKNALLPLITIVGIRLGFMIGGALMTETIFSWPGLGWTTYQAVAYRDYPVLQGVFLIITILVVLSNFVADIIYGYIDPRIRVGEAKNGR